MVDIAASTKQVSGFPAQHYNNTSVSDALKTEEINIIWMQKIEKTKEVYNRFNEDFKLFLSKMPSNDVKKYVEFVFNKGLVFIGISKGKTPAIFSRLLLTRSEKVAGIVLDSNDLDISLSTGETPSIDDCIYAVYYSLIRAGVLLNKNEIAKDKELHKNLVIYLNQIFLRSLGKGTIYNEKQKYAIMIACIYIYHRHYLQQKHLSALSFLKRNYSNIVDKSSLEEVVPKLEATSKYSNMQDIAKILVDLKIMTTNPNRITMNLLRNLTTSGFYSLIGSLDLFIGFVVLSRYPTGLYPRTAIISDKLHSTVEQIMVKYVSKVSYDTKAIPRGF
jgi:hypothetical protein